MFENIYIFIGFLCTIIMMFFAIKNDLKNNTIKNIIPLTGFTIGFVLTILNKGNVFISLIVCVLFFLLLFAVPRSIGIKEFLGAGDIKIYMAIILLVGYKVGIYTFIYATFVGVIGLFILNVKKIKNTFSNIEMFFVLDKKAAINLIDKGNPNIFSPYILIGFLISYIQIIILKNDWLFNMFKDQINNFDKKSLIIYILIVSILIFFTIKNKKKKS